MRRLRMIRGDRDRTTNRKRKAAMWGGLAAAVPAMTVVGVLAVGGPAQATFPDRNGPIAFSGDKGSGGEIYTMKADGTGLRRLTHLGGDANTPEWSPDGARIAFFSHSKLATRRGTNVMNADGGDVHRVTAAGDQAAFTRDGQHLVYDCEFCDPDGVFLMRDDGSDAPGLRLTGNPFPTEGDANPEVSPDGQTVTFVRRKNEHKLQALCAVDIDGSHLRRLTSYRREVAVKHDWAPNGRQIVLTTNGDYPDHKSPNVATMRPDGSHLRMLTHFTGGEKGAYAGSYSPDGRWIVFRIENLKRERFRLLKMHPDGSHRKLIKRLPFAPRQSDWGPRP